jgi:hypothetical protein|tara:strand:- start:1914 stop:2132 length:219 start_codon:yes stop_codon:yes gene_type:complete
VTSFFRLLTAALNAYIEYVRLQKDKRIDSLEDELDRLASDGSAASKLRIERIAQRLKRERIKSVRPPNDNLG